MLKLLVLILLCFQLWAIKPVPSARCQDPVAATALAFVVVPSRFVRRRREFELCDAEEAPEDNLQYGAWGELKGGNTLGRASPFGFTGRWGGFTDGRTGLVKNWNRDLDPRTGRWVSRDPIGIKGGYNLFVYVRNNPPRRIDPIGLYSSGCPCGEAATQASKVGPSKAWKAKSLADEALALAEQLAASFGEQGELHNGRWDAFRHCYWSCLMAQQIGADSAASVGRTHEACGDPAPNETAQDLHNNMVGIDIGKSGGNCQSGCIAAMRNGRTDNHAAPAP